jgi:hypothetical protein
MVPKNGTGEQFLMQKLTILMEHPPCSSDLAPCDFFLFPTIKKLLKGAHFKLLEVVHQHMLHMLKAISEDRFHKCFQMWQKTAA